MAKDNSKLKAQFLEYFRKVPIQKFAAAYVGVNQDTVTDWKKSDSDFSDAIGKAKAQFVSRKVEVVRSPEWLLERIFKQDFAERKEHTGKDGERLMPTFIIQTTEAKEALTILYDQGSDKPDDQGLLK